MIGTPPAEAYAIVQALAQCREISGDVCEFGVCEGETSALIASEILSTRKVLHLFDSFCGLPQPTGKDHLKDDIFSLGSMAAYAGKMACPEDVVQARLAAIAFPSERSVIHKGFVEQVLGEDKNLPAQVSCAYIDLDFYEPIKTALQFLHERTPIGAVIIVDDYDFFSTGAKTAVDEFLGEVNVGATRYECAIPNRRYGCFAVLTRRG